MKLNKWRIFCLAVGLVLCLPQSLIAQEWGDVDIHGFVSQGYLKSSDNNYLAETEKGTYEFNEAGINFSAVRDKLRIGAQLFARDLGDMGNHEVEIDWAVGDYRLYDALGLRAGRIKIPQGLYNQARDVDLARTPILLPSAVYDEGSRDLVNAIDGFGIYGDVDAGKAGSFEYEAFLGVLNMDSEGLFVRNTVSGFVRTLNLMTAGSSTGEMSLENTTVDNESMFGGAVRYDAGFVPGLRLGAYFMKGNNEGRGDMVVTLPDGAPYYGATVDAGELVVDNELTAQWVLSAEYTIGSLILAAEWTQLNLEYTVSGTGMAGVPAIESTGEGYYVQASYQFLDWLTLGVYYSEYYPDADDKDGDRFALSGEPDYLAWQKEIVPTVRFDIKDNWVMKLETHFFDGVGRVSEYLNPDGFEDDWILYAAKTTFSF